MFTKPVSFQDGPSFCHYCVTLCPVNRTVSGGTLVGNIAVEGAISRRIIKCPSTISLPGGCNWTGPTGSLENHLPHRNMKIVGYNYEGRGCILCSYQHELPQHLLICPHWTEKCPPPSFGVDISHNDQSGYDELCQQIGTMSEQLWDSGGKVDCSP